MLWHVCSLVCLLFISCQCQEPLDCSDKAAAKTVMMRLKLNLLCGYDKYLRPVIHHTNQTTVRLIIAPRIVDFEDYTSTLRLKSWLSMNWEDEHLKWDKLEYDNIDSIILDTSMVWVPDLSLYNAKDDMSLTKDVAPVLIDHRGSVSAFLSPVLEGHCVPNFANWPYDVHQCTLTLGSQRYVGSTMDLDFFSKHRGLWMNYLLPNKRWDLVKTNVSRNETQFGTKNESLYLVSINCDFTLKRHASVFIATCLVPGVVLVLVSLGSLWIPSHRTERMAVLCCLVLLQTMGLHYLAYEIPFNGDSTPYLVCFYRDCLFLSGLLVIQTLVTRSLTTCTSNPSYLQSTFRLATSNRVLQLILVYDLDPKIAAKLTDTGNEEGSTLVVADNNVHQWQMFVNIINRVCFILLVPVYLLLSISLMPFNFSFSPN